MFTPASSPPVSSVDSLARRGRVLLLAAGASGLVLGLTGCGASSPSRSSQGGEVAYPSSDEGGASSTASDTDGAESDSLRDSQPHGGAGGPPEDAPAPVSEASEGEAEAPFEALQQVAAEYDRVLTQGGVDCSTAQDLVQRICYLAERVCGLSGVAGRDTSEQEADAQCTEGRARCARSEVRLRAACPSAR